MTSKFDSDNKVPEKSKVDSSINKNMPVAQEEKSA